MPPPVPGSTARSLLHARRSLNRCTERTRISSTPLKRTISLFHYHSIRPPPPPFPLSPSHSLLQPNDPWILILLVIMHRSSLSHFKCPPQARSRNSRNGGGGGRGSGCVHPTPVSNQPFRIFEFPKSTITRNLQSTLRFNQRVDIMFTSSGYSRGRRWF